MFALSLTIKKNNMKQLLSIFFFGASMAVFSQEIVTSIADVKAVTVYSGAAEVNNKIAVKIPSGTSKIVIGNVAADFDEQSVQLSAPDYITVLSVSKGVLKDFELQTPVFTRLKDSLEQSDSKLQQYQLMLSANEGALKLLNNDKLLANDTKVASGDIAKVVDYYKTKYVELQNEMLKYRKLYTEESKENKKLKEKIRAFTGADSKLIIQVTSSKATSLNIEMSYMTYSAWWVAYYDLRAANTSSPLKFIYKASVTQNTGVDWNNAKLILSTGNPTQSGVAPVFSPAYIQFYAPSIPGMYPTQNKIQRMESRAPMADKAEAELDEMVVTTPKTTQTQNQLATTFEIEIPYTIKSNGEPHSVTLKEFEHPVVFKYYSVPKLDKDVFLLAEIGNFESLNLIPGEANIIFENMYVGKSYINPYATSDTLNLSMGRDKMISVKRERIMDEKSSQVSGGTKRQTYVYDIKVKNNKATDVNMLLKEQFPISTDKSVDVELVETSGAAINKEVGVLTWKLALKPGETQTYRVKFIVKHPKDQQIYFN